MQPGFDGPLRVHRALSTEEGTTAQALERLPDVERLRLLAAAGVELLILDRELAARYGVPLNQPAEVVSLTFRGRRLPRFRTPSGEREMRLTLDERETESLSQLRNLPLWTADGEKVPLASLALVSLALQVTVVVPTGKSAPEVALRGFARGSSPRSIRSRLKTSNRSTAMSTSPRTSSSSAASCRRLSGIALTVCNWALMSSPTSPSPLVEPVLKRPDAVRQVLDYDILPAIGTRKLNIVTTAMQSASAMLCFSVTRNSRPSSEAAIPVAATATAML